MWLRGGGVGLASEAAYFAKIPGNQKWAPRPTPINSWNFFHFSPYHNFMRGKPDNNPWGPAVTMFRTANGTPLYFNFHVTPLEERSIGKRPLGICCLQVRLVKVKLRCWISCYASA
ncbi:hypothetical protein CFA70_28685 (plasmid) [Citrobacter freundii]|uniref:hypothetical protein n=1 Tax=Citrobacter freundii TaxID=546 RepID=UPI000B5A4186|nr:hypothetical protein [Citrobacter freundii]ASK03926.1 hypothetical protein CFA70_28685 [Citrobacter freundii]